MTIPKADSKDIERALDEFDSRLRETAEWSGWRDKETFKWAIVRNGHEYPVKQIIAMATGISHSDFSGGPESNDYLRGLGFDVEPLRTVVHTPRPKVWIEKTLVAGRPDRQSGPEAIGLALWSPQRAKGGADIYRFMRVVEPGDVVLHLTDNLAFTGISRAAATAQEFAGLAGTSWGEQDSYRVPLRDYRQLNPPFDRSWIFKSERTPKFLALANKLPNLFYNSKLELNQGAYLTPAPPELASLLQETYSAHAGLPLFEEGVLLDQQIHVLLKWSAGRNPDTIERHSTIAAEKGAVWWGAFGDPTRPGLSDNRIKQLNDQISQGIETAAFLSNQGSTYRTRLLNVTRDPNDVDADRLPGYYSKAQCKVFFLLADLRRIERDWLLSNLALASQPNLTIGEGALANQTSPLVVVQTTPIQSGPIDPMDRLLRETLWTRTALEQILDVLRSGQPRQVVLAGPPGTGKTWVAKALVRYLTNDVQDRWRIVQFHPSYTYEQFIEGLRPAIDTDTKAIVFERANGIVLQMVERIRAQENPVDHYLLIDEMNRANLPRVLGELLYLFEYRNEQIDLPYTHGFTLPTQLRFVSTMNTADRSIRSIDSALRRRFDVFECSPDPQVLDRYYQQPGRKNSVPNLVAGFIALNQRLSADIDEHHTVGQTFFMAPEFTPRHLCQVWSRQLRPLIQEYFFDSPKLAASYSLAEFWPGIECEQST